MNREKRKVYYLECFMDAFAQNGIDKTSIKKLAQAADMNEASIYQYFKNKNEIIVECVKLYYRNIETELFPAILDQTLPLETKVKRIICYYSKIQDREKFVIQVLTHPTYGQMCSPIVQKMRGNLEKISEALSAQHLVPPQIISSFILFFWSTLLSDKILNEEKILSRQVNYLLDFIKGQSRCETPRELDPNL